MLAPRWYQVEAVSALRESLRKERSALYVLPTGGGKTMVYALIARSAIERGSRVIISVHRKELLNQILRAFSSFEIPFGKITADETTDGLIQVASTPTLARRLGKIEPPKLLICEEAHHATAATSRKIIDTWRCSKVLGVTATPTRLDGTGLGEVFDRMVLGPSVERLQQEGFLARMRYLVPPPVADLDGLKIVAGDYERSESAHRMDKPHVTGDAAQHYLNICPQTRAIAFCVNVRHAENVAAAFSARGISAASIDGTMNARERDERLSALEDGRLHVLTSVDLIGEGLDVPAIGAVILLRPTASLVFHLQALGRAMRVATGKKHGIVLDHVGNLLRHGPAEQVREWTLEGKKRTKQDAETVLPYRRCGKCFAMFPTGRNACPECGSAPELTRKEIEQREGELREIEVELLKLQAKKERSRAATYEELLELGRSRNYKNPAWWANCVLNGRTRKRAHE